MRTQTLKASKALLKHIKSKSKLEESSPTSKNLLANNDSDNHFGREPIWLILTTKKHIIPQKRLKPGKISIPHSLNTSPNLSICLITSEPQRATKDLIAHPSFPPALAKRITRVIDVKKLEKKYFSFESKRQLLDSHNIFLADDRIVTYLPKILGKTFYATTTKRPIPIHLKAYKDKIEKVNAALPSTKPSKEKRDPKSITTPALAAHEIERTLSMAQVNLAPSVTTAVRVGLDSFEPEQLTANIEAVVAAMVEKYVPKQWRGIKSIHIKGPNTMALPIWLAEELWEDEEMVIEDQDAEDAKLKALQKGKSKRRMLEEETVEREQIKGVDEKASRKKKRKMEEDDLSQEMKERREKLRQQKREVRAKLEGEASKDVLVDENQAKPKKTKRVAPPA